MKRLGKRISTAFGALMIGAAVIGLAGTAGWQQVGAFLAPAAHAGGPQVPKGPVLPFEREYAARRHEHSVLSFNDHIARVPGNRILDLPTVNGRMGDRVTLTEGQTLFFPVGYLVTATYRIDKLRPRRGVASPASATDLEANPDYAFVKRFDAEFGQVCARTVDKASDISVEFRILPGKTMTVILDTPGRYDAIGSEKTRSYGIFVGQEERYVVLDQISRRLLAHCRSGAKQVDVAYDGSPISLAMLTGTAPR